MQRVAAARGAAALDVPTTRAAGTGTTMKLRRVFVAVAVVVMALPGWVGGEDLLLNGVVHLLQLILSALAGGSHILGRAFQQLIQFPPGILDRFLADFGFGDVADLRDGVFEYALDLFLAHGILRLHILL